MKPAAATDPLVSVVIPTYNRAARLRQALQSVLTQDYPAMEVLVVDDASTDGTAAMMAEFDDERIRYIRHETNRGGSAARNTGLRAATGEFIAFLDSDDEWAEGKLASQVALLQRSPDRVGLVYGGAAYRYPDGSVRYMEPRARGRVYEQMLLRNVIVGGTTVPMIRSSVLAQVDGFDEALPASQDMDFWLRIAEHYDVDYVPRTLATIDFHDEPLRISNAHRKRVVARERFFQKHGEAMRRAGVAHRYLSEMGRIQHRRLHDLSAARATFRRALEERPLAPSTHAFLAATYIPEGIYATAGAAARGLGRTLLRLRGSLRRGSRPEADAG